MNEAPDRSRRALAVTRSERTWRRLLGRLLWPWAKAESEMVEMGMAMRTEVRRHAAAVFVQVESLQALYAELRLERGLPQTRDWAASPDILLLLARRARERRPRIVVECGSGISTVVLARCMQLNERGQVYSLEHDPSHAMQTRRELARHGLEAFASVLDVSLRPYSLGGMQLNWYDLEALEIDDPIELLFIDGPPRIPGLLTRYPCGPLLFKRLAAGAAAVLDDAARPEEQEAVQRWLAEDPTLRADDVPCEKGCVVLHRGV